VAYVRFASVYKGFQGITDFEREVGLLLEKKEVVRPAKRRGA
jgi:transcriptional regulator NrdR family protein